MKKRYFRFLGVVFTLFVFTSMMGICSKGEGIGVQSKYLLSSMSAQTMNSNYIKGKDADMQSSYLSSSTPEQKAELDLNNDVKVLSLSANNNQNNNQGIPDQLDDLANTLVTYMTAKTTYELKNIEYEDGVVISTQGFYTLNDDGGAQWLVKSTTGNEVWVSTGYGFDISQDCEIKCSTNKKLVFIGKSISTRQIGCKADGVSDDSIIIQTLFKSTCFSEAKISEGVHIINITAGTSHSEYRVLISNAKIYKVTGIKDKSIIKLGSGNCDERVYRGFESLFRYAGADVDVEWSGVTFDFNPEQNPLYHFGAQYASVEMNSQNFAINGAYIRNFKIVDCTFIGHSGTNCLNYRCNSLNTNDSIINISGNKFLNTGVASKYQKPDGSIVDAFHDHSTISIHNDDTDRLNYAFKSYAYIENNVFKGIGGNAYNACECGTDVQYFDNNVIEKYAIGHLILNSRKNVISHSFNNTLADVTHGILVWTYNVETAEVNELGFKLVDIKDNYIKVNPDYWKDKPHFSEYTLSNGYYTHIYSGIEWGVLYRNIDDLTINNNIIEYVTSSTLTSLGTYIYNGMGINFGNPFSSTAVSSFTINPFINNLNITNNTFKNCYRKALVYVTYPSTRNINVIGNNVYNCGHDTALTERQHVFDIQLVGDMTGFPYCSNPIMHAYSESIIFENNYIINTPFSYMLKVSFWENTFNVPDSLFKFKNNTTNIDPITVYYLLQGSASSISKKITDVN